MLFCSDDTEVNFLNTQIVHGVSTDQLLTGVISKAILIVFTKFTGKYLNLQPVNLSKKRLQCCCFIMNFKKFFRAASLVEYFQIERSNQLWLL